MRKILRMKILILFRMKPVVFRNHYAQIHCKGVLDTFYFNAALCQNIKLWTQPNVIDQRTVCVNKNIARSNLNQGTVFR